MAVVVVLDVVAREYSAVGTCGCGVTGCDRTRVYITLIAPPDFAESSLCDLIIM